MNKADKGTVDGWQESRQMVRDLLDLQISSGLTGDKLLLLLGLLSVFGSVEFLGRRRENGEGQSLQRMIGTLASSFLTGGQGLKQEELQGVRGGEESAGGGKEGWKVLMSLLSNPEVLRMVLPLLSKLTGGAGSNTTEAAEAEGNFTSSRRRRAPELMRWDLGRNDPRRKG
ncbi:MAG: hypothetical protein AB1500_12125 [Bacillota bacterium]